MTVAIIASKMRFVPTTTPTPSHRLADLLLGDAGPLEHFVRSRRADKVPWRRIEDDLRDTTDRQVDLTYETLRSWFPDHPPAKAKRRARS